MKELAETLRLFPRRILVLGVVVFIGGLLGFSGLLQAASQAEPFGDLSFSGPGQVEITGDKVEVSIADNKVMAQGHVTVKKEDVTLTCDRIEYSRSTQIGIAEGHVVLTRKETQMEGDRMKFDFGAMKGDFINAEFFSPPFKGVGQKVEKVGENHLRVSRGYISTCDLDLPHYRAGAKKVDIYPKDKAVARNVTLRVGTVPMFYLPKFTQDLKGKDPVFIVTPGYSKRWGAFLLSQYRYRFTDHLRGVVHADYRTRKDFASGFDVNYETQKFGAGIIRTYYMNEGDRGKHDSWQKLVKDVPHTPLRERFKIEYRHKWDIDSKTQAIGQYYKLSDADFLEDYFKREFNRDSSPPTYFLLTRNLTASTVSFRTDVRVNRFEGAVERLPELNYTLSDIQLGESGFYFKDTTTFSNLTKKSASPSEIRQKTMRLDTQNQISYPFKFNIFELRPFAGTRETYYSRTIDPQNYNSVRTLFETGSDLSTKFYRIFDVKTDKWGLNINKLRHVVTPSVAYFYTHEPTVPNSWLDQYDTIDSLTAAHGMKFSLENKLQTKRNDKSEDLVRFILGTDFRLKEDAGKGGFQNVTSDIEVKPYPWFTLYLDSLYDTIQEHLETVNADIYLNDVNNRWYIGLGDRYSHKLDNQITAEWGYTINPKWKFRVYERVDVMHGINKEQEYTLRRDLHCWTMDLSYRERRGEGSEIWIVFTNKAFPKMLSVDLGTSYNGRKAGTQTNP